ncbi:aspartic peptidase A1 family protein, partial [Tanacetum coccineum]
KDVGKGVSCLAFLSGGSRAKDAIVIGTYQMENNFLYFDLVNQKLGFSSSLLARGTSCGWVEVGIVFLQGYTIGGILVKHFPAIRVTKSRKLKPED